MTNRVVVIVVICGLLIIASNFRDLPSVKAKSEKVSFSLHSLKPVEFSANFNTSIEVVDGSLEPNGTTTVSIRARAIDKNKMNMSLWLPAGEEPEPIPIAFDVDPLPENNKTISITKEGKILNLTLTLKGSIEGDLEVQGPGHLSARSWKWQGSQIYLTNSSKAKVGDQINVTLRNIRYNMSAKLLYYYNSSGTFIPYHSEINGSNAIPQSVVGTFKIEYPFPWRTAVWGGVAALGVSSFAFGVLCTISKRELKHIQKRKTHATALRVEHVAAEKTCSSCGTPNSPEAKFCKKCGMQL
jgi:ribosomal protein L40E